MRKRVELKIRQNNDFVTAIRCNMCHDNQAIGMAERQQSEQNLRVNSVLSSVEAFKCCELYDVCNDVAMGDHDGFLCDD